MCSDALPSTGLPAHSHNPAPAMCLSPSVSSAQGTSSCLPPLSLSLPLSLFQPPRPLPPAWVGLALARSRHRDTLISIFTQLACCTHGLPQDQTRLWPLHRLLRGCAQTFMFVQRRHHAASAITSIISKALPQRQAARLQRSTWNICWLCAYLVLQSECPAQSVH